MSETAEQLELTPCASDPLAEEVERMVAQLRGCGWRTATDLGARSENEKRHIRAICEASGARIVSGAHGYRLAAEMSVEEYQACRGRLRAMARGILMRVKALDLAFHNGGARS